MMRIEEHSSENICRALGLFGFANDPLLLQAKRAIRLLITPAREPETCITICADARQARVSIVCARSRLFARPGATVLKERDNGVVEPAKFDSIAELIRTAAVSPKYPEAILDGITVHALLVDHNGKRTEMRDNVYGRSPLKPAVQTAVSVAWGCLTNESCRHMLSVIGEMVGENLPRGESSRPGTATTAR